MISSSSIPLCYEKKIMMSTRCWWIKSFYVDCNKKLTVKLTKLPSFITLSYTMLKRLVVLKLNWGTYKKYLFSKSKSTSLYHVLELVWAMKSPYYSCISTDKCLWKNKLQLYFTHCLVLFTPRNFLTKLGRQQLGGRY